MTIVGADDKRVRSAHLAHSEILSVPWGSKRRAGLTIFAVSVGATLFTFLRSKRPGQLNCCGRIRPNTLIVGTETGHFPADEPHSVVWSSCSSVCGSCAASARRREPDARLWCVQWELGVLSPPFLMCMEASSRSSVPGSAGSVVGALAVGRLPPCQIAWCAGYFTDHGPT